MDAIPAQIVMANRTGTPTLEVLAQQVTALARLLTGTSSDDLDRDTALVNAVISLNAKVPKGAVASSSGRALSSTFQVSATNPALVFYTVEMTVTAALVVAQDAGVQMLCDTSSSPSTLVGEVHLAAVQTSGVSLVPIQTVARQMIAAFVPAGTYVTLTPSGAGTSTLVGQTEVVFP